MLFRRLLSKPAKTSALLVEFRTGLNFSEIYRYTDWTSDLDLDGTPTFVSVPTIQYEPSENNGSLSERPTEISFPRNIDDFMAKLAAGQPLARTSISIREVHFDARTREVGEILYFFYGMVQLVINNPRGKTEQVLLQCIPHKSRINAVLGLVANHECNNTLYGPGCWVHKPSFTDAGTVDAIDGKVITLSGHDAKGENFYHRGWMERDGVSIIIRKFNFIFPNVFHLTRNPPEEWLGQEVDIVAGCDLSAGTCIIRFDNEEHFNGTAIAVPDYNPIIEDPG